MELRAPGIETTTRQGWSRAAHSWGRDGAAVSRRGVEGVVVEGDAVLVLGIRGRTRYAQAHVPKRRSHHRVT